MLEHERGNFFTAKGPDRSELPGWYEIRLRVTNFPDPRLVTDGSISISGWQLAEHRDRYLAEFTDAELMELERLEYAMWSASPEGGTKSLRWRLSTALERLKRAVQKRCGKELADS